MEFDTEQTYILCFSVFIIFYILRLRMQYHAISFSLHVKFFLSYQTTFKDACKNAEPETILRWKKYSVNIKEV